MNGAKLILSAGICLGVAAAMASGCGSSSSPPPVPPTDSGPSPDVQVVDSSAESGGAVCDPLALKLCPQGQTCCFSGLGGTCTDIGACERPFKIACVNTATCGGGVCCGSVQFPAGFDAAAFATDAAFDASGFDASAFDASGFDSSGFGVTLACNSSCLRPEFQVCMTSQDCPSGQVCGNGGMMGNGLGLILACVPADAGAPPPDAGPDASPGPADASGNAPDGG